jgi:tetratricopeptide (TPR) repeat protein
MLTAGTWQPTPLREFILKIHSRCDLSCHYCYMYQMADQGEASARRGDADAAVDHYHRAAGLFEVLQDLTQVGESLAEAGRVSLARGRRSAAAEDLRAAIVRIPHDQEVQTDLAQALWFNGQQHASLAILNSVLAQEGNLVPALRTRGEILADMGKAADALHDLDRVRYQQAPSTQAARALALALEGRFDAAGQEAADALASGGDNGPMLLRVARVRALAGPRDEAAQFAMAALAATERPLPPHLKDYAQRLLGELSGTDVESTGAMGP